MIDHVPHSVEFFNIVFFAVVVSTLLQGMSFERLAGALSGLFDLRRISGQVSEHSKQAGHVAIRNMPATVKALDDVRGRRLARAADYLVKLFETETGRSFAGRGAPDEISAALDAVRPVALDAAGLILAQELERALRKLAATGSSKSRRG